MADERGRLKVFIGMAPGVGKTFRMLQEGRAEAENGRDVLIGYLEPHGRAETVAQAEGLETVPRRHLTYRGTPLEEMDRRFSAAGGLGSLLNLYEQVRRELERVSFEELDRMTLEIKTVIEALLKMDYELRKVHNLKLAFETRPPGAGVLG